MDFLNKKGILFTLLSIFISSFFVLVFSSNINLPLDSKVDVVSFRVNALHRYQESWEDYAESALRSSSYRALNLMSEWTNANGISFGSASAFRADFSECLLNGTIANSIQNCSANGPKNNLTLSYWLDNMVNLASSNLSINTTYEVLFVDINQQFPFHVYVDLYLNYTIQDAFSKITRNITVRAITPVEGIRDPLAGAYLSDPDRFIKETSTKESEWNLNNLTSFINNKEYRHHPDAPSFLQRFIAGIQFSSSTCCGIEGVFSTNLLLDGSYAGFLENRSYVDYIYIQDLAAPSMLCDVVFYPSAGLSPDVQIDQLHLASFNISTSSWLTTC